MKFNQAIKLYGTQAALAEALGVKQPNVSNWKTRGRIPPLQQIRLEQITGGKLKADAGIMPKVSRV